MLLAPLYPTFLGQVKYRRDHKSNSPQQSNKDDSGIMVTPSQSANLRVTRVLHIGLKLLVRKESSRPLYLLIW